MRSIARVAVLAPLLAAALGCERLTWPDQGNGHAICVCIGVHLAQDAPPPYEDMALGCTSKGLPASLQGLARKGWSLREIELDEFIDDGRSLRTWYLYLENPDESAVCESEPGVPAP